MDVKPERTTNKGHGRSSCGEAKVMIGSDTASLWQ